MWKGGATHSMPTLWVTLLFISRSNPPQSSMEIVLILWGLVRKNWQKTENLILKHLLVSIMWIFATDVSLPQHKHSQSMFHENCISTVLSTIFKMLKFNVEILIENIGGLWVWFGLVFKKLCCWSDATYATCKKGACQAASHWIPNSD